MRRVVWSLLCCLLCLCLSPSPGWSRSFPHPADAELAAQQRWGARVGGSVLSGCHATVVPPLTLTLTACRGMTFDSTDPATLAGFEEPSARTLTLPAATGTVWVAGRRDPGATPPGWTCQPGQHYCWITSQAAPALPPGLTWLFEVPVASGAIIAVKDITTRTLVQPLPLPQPLTLGRLAQWTVEPGGTIDLAAGVTLTIGGCLEAGLTQVFTGANALTGVRWAAKARCSTIRPEWWGAQGDGLDHGGEQTYFKAASDALPFGGVLLAAGPTAHYVFTAGWNITTSGLWFDGQMALFSSTTTGVTNLRFDVNPNVGQAGSGNKALLLRNVHLRNWRVGTDNTTTQRLLGARLQWCEHCSVDNVFKKGATTTAFNLYNCYDCRMSNLHIEGSDGAGFALLAHFIFDSTIENVYITQGDSALGPTWFLQVKGGENSRVVGCSVADVPYADALIAFFNRGDDPDDFSNTSPETQPYPWPTNGALDCTVSNCYSLPDPRRASISMLFDNLTVTRVPHAKAFSDQESVGTLWTNLVAHDVRNGITLARSHVATAVERNFAVDGFRFTSIGTTAGLGTAGIGVQVQGSDLGGGNLEGIRVSNGLIANATAEGVLATYVTDLVVERVRVLNVGLNLTGTAAGIRVGVDAQRPIVSNNYVRDDQATPTLTHGIFVTNAAVRPTLMGNRVDCAQCPFGTFFGVQSWVPGYYGVNKPALCTARTTSVTPVTDRCRLLLLAEEVVSVVAKCTAKEGQSNRAYYEKHFVVWDNGGTATTVTTPTPADTELESDASWTVSATNSGRDWWLSLVGGAGQTVDWYCDLVTLPIN